tara:strand:+ start:635 stop:1573 length:939 start_codon:yes stop_codon:yes gene_type:complete
MDNILQPIRQYVVHIRSKDAEREGNLNSHLFINLQEPITINPKTEQIHQIVLSGEIPYSMYNISSDVKNNEIIYNGTSKYTLPTKNYDINELVRVLNNDILFPLAVSYDKYTMKLTFTNNSGNTITINWNLSNSSKVMGFDDAGDIEIINTGISISPNVIDLATIHSLFIKSNASSTMVFSTRKGFSQTIQKVSIDVNSGNIIYLNQNDSRQHTVLNSNVDAMDIRITDQNDNLVNFNNINYELTIGFFIYPINRTGNRRNLDIKTIQQPRNPLQPFTPSIMVNEDIDNVETDIEHQEKRRIIDKVLEKMGK